MKLYGKLVTWSLFCEMMGKHVFKMSVKLCKILGLNWISHTSTASSVTASYPPPFPVTQLCVSSYRAITYYQSSEHTKHKTRGTCSIRHEKTHTCPLKLFTFLHLHRLRTCSSFFSVLLIALKLPDVPQKSDHWIPFTHYHLLSAKLPGCLQQQR